MNFFIFLNMKYFDLASYDPADIRAGFEILISQFE